MPLIKEILKYLVIILLIMNSLPGFSQVKPKNDSTNVYNKLENYSKKRKATKFLHKLVFRSTNIRPNNPREQKIAQNYSEFEGKIIRKITTISHDPFGFSFTDSTETANSWIEKTGNHIHSKTKPFAIRNFLLIKEGMPLDSITVTESERLLRSQNFIRSVEIRIKNSVKNPETVDIVVEVLDSWSLIPKVDISTSKNSLKLKDRNFFGLGHEFRSSIKNRLKDGKNAYDFRYTVPNFKKTFVRSSVGYNIDLNGYYVKDFYIDRPFYSPLAKWAGGISYDERYRKERFENEILGSSEEALKFQTQDVWVGHAFQLFKGRSVKERTTQLITSARLLHTDFMEAPQTAYDSINYFSNETFYMGSVGITSRQFIQDTYIFRDGIVEDVPVGTIFAGMAGIQHKNKGDRLYLGAKVSHGNYFSWGYLSTNFEFGTFFKDDNLEQTTYSFQANYFTNLMSLGSKWKMRQFIKPQFLIGINRLNSIGDRLTIADNNRFQGVYANQDQRDNNAGIPGFDSEITGTKKYVLSLQTQFYSPWEVLGFRLNPFLNLAAGVIGNEGTSIKKNRLYSELGLGFIIRNDYLVFSSFQFSFSYYPTIPGDGTNVFKTNSVETDDFGFQNFELGKPTPAWYN